MSAPERPPVGRFVGRFYDLSNFGGRLDWISSEHLYHLCKAKPGDWESQLYILAADSPGEAKRRGNAIPLREDWEKIKYDVMTVVVQVKFAPGTKFAQLLLSTDDRELIEGNYHGDSYWGVDLRQDFGANKLGEILMWWRDQLREMEGQ